jgi:adenine-specific DNA methylase
VLASASTTPADAGKLRGGYYTPPAVAAYLAREALRDGATRVLEPSCGDGEILAALAEVGGPDLRACAVELSPAEAARAAARAGPAADVLVGDAFAWYEERRPDGAFEAVAGNPPFIRYQSFPEEHREPAFRLMRDEGLTPTRLTNAWVPFVVLATRALRPGGRCALVVPAEILQVGYAAQLREYLTRRYAHLELVTFRRLLFAKAQQEVVLLLGVRAGSDGENGRNGNGPCDIRIREVDDAEGLHEAAGPRLGMDLDHAREKWTRYFLSARELGLVRALEDAGALTTLGALAEVDVGVVTGRNACFVLDEPSARAAGVVEHCLPLVGRSAQIPGLVLGQGEWEAERIAGGRCLLLQLGPRDRAELDAAALGYVEAGEAQGWHAGYKCRIRQPRWWHVPSVWVPDAFLLRQIHDAPRIVRNDAGATCTDTIHRVRVRPGVDAGVLAAASLSSLTLAFAELRGRSYGGGVLELEPTEAESLPFPRLDAGAAAQLPAVEELDKRLRRAGLEAVLDEVDRTLLRPLGLSDGDIALLRGIWRRLAARRRGRRH